MKKLVTILGMVALILALSIFLFPPQTINAADFSVPSPAYPTIQSAINAASSGDTVHVAAGTYNERITLMDGVQVLGAGAAVTTIDGDGSGPVVMADGVDTGAKLDGFTITNGLAAKGGGMYNYYSVPRVTNCTFSGNSADESGGGMYNYYSAPRVTNCTFSGNSADESGGGMYNYYSLPWVTNCTFSGNSADKSGGGMYNFISALWVTGCAFTGNSANINGGGMCNAISSYMASPRVDNCTFTDNTAGGFGGGAYNDLCPTRFVNCILSGNTTGIDGGGMFNDSCSIVATNSTFLGNSADSGAGCGGMYTEGSSAPVVTNCIFWDVGMEIIIEDLVAYITYSDIEGGYLGTGNINSDPLFVNPAAGDFHLQHGSPCIDAGDNSALSLPATDFEGDDRILDGNEDLLALVDMGVDEAYVTDLAIIKSGVPDPVIAGTDITYNITVNNNGPRDASGVVVIDTLPVEVDFKSAETHGTGTYGSSTGVWDGFGLANGQEASLTLVAALDPSTPAGTIISNTATVKGNFCDPASTNDRDTVTIEVITRADLNITSTACPYPVIAGTDLTYTNTVTNGGPSNATGVLVTAILPAGVTFQSATPSAGNYDSSTGIWNGFGLKGGSSATLHIVVRVYTPAVDGKILTNTARVTAQETDPDTLDNTSAVDTTVQAPVMEIAKTASLAIDADGDGVPGPGDTLKYTATLKNDGSGPAYGVMFIDTPDVNTTLVVGGVTKSLGTVTRGNYPGDKTVEVSMGTLPPGGTATVTFKVTINSPLWEFFVANQAAVTGSNFDPVKSDDPSTPRIGDATVTKVKMSPPVHGPGLSQWGIIILVVLFGGAIAWVIHRKRLGSNIQ